jgi:hypothetical protein
MNIGTATAPPANGVDDVNHADASGAAAVNKDSSLNTVRTPSNDVKVLASARDDVVGETEPLLFEGDLKDQLKLVLF